MSTLALIPDLEALAGNVLRNHDAIIGLDARVAGRIPKSFTKPWIRVTQLDALKEPNSPIDHLISYLVQIDVWAGSETDHGQAEASLLARTARAVLMGLRGQVIDGVVIARVETRSMARIPDLDFDPPRERYLLSVEIWAHA